MGCADWFIMEKVRIEDTKFLFLSYCANEPLIHLTRSSTLGDWQKLEVLSGVMVEKTSWWQIVGSQRGQPWSKKVWCYSGEGSVDVCLQDRVSVIEEDLDRFFLYLSNWT